jgi:hypothetical protein
MISTQTLRLNGLKNGRLVFAVIAVSSMAAIAVGLLLAWRATTGSTTKPHGIISYTTTQGEASVRPDGQAVTIGLPAAVPVVTNTGTEEFSAPDGQALASVERDDAGAWLALRGVASPGRVAQLTDPSSPPLVNGVKGDAQVVGGVPLTVAWSPDSRYLAYGSLTGRPYTLHIVDRTTGDQQSFIVDGGFVGELAWSAQGRLAISTYSDNRRDHSTYVLNPNGGIPVRLIDGCHVVWSPDGRYLVLHRDPQRAPGAWVVAADGSSAYALTNEQTAFPLTWRAE